MANSTHVALLKAGVKAWNRKRPGTPDLSGAALSKQNLEGADLSHANLDGSDLLGANLRDANLSHARLRRANLWRCRLRGAVLGGASFFKADLSGAELGGANLARADLYRVNFTAAMLAKANLRRARLEKATLVAANLRGADLSYADLTECSLSRANVQDCDFTGARIYGAGIWDCRGTPKSQNGLVITRRADSPVTVDNLKVGQFIYLLLTNPDIRDVIDTITSKSVLILGNFSRERKPALDAMREAIRQRNLTPIVFDFEIPENRDVTETVKVLAGLAKFVVADITDATEVRAELHTIVKEFPSLPIQPLLLVGTKAFVSFPQNLVKYPWVLPPFEYTDLDHLLASLDTHVLAPAIAKQRELVAR